MEDKELTENEQSAWRTGHRKALQQIREHCELQLLDRYGTYLQEQRKLLDVMKKEIHFLAAQSGMHGCTTRELQEACQRKIKDSGKFQFYEALLLGIQQSEIVWNHEAALWQLGKE